MILCISRIPEDGTSVVETCGVIFFILFSKITNKSTITINLQIITLLHVSTLSCHLQTARIHKYFTPFYEIKWGKIIIVTILTYVPVQARQQQQHTDCIYGHHTDGLRKNCNNNDFTTFYCKLDNFNVLNILL